MTSKFEQALKKAIHDKIGCCEETLIVTLVTPQKHSYLVHFYIPSLDRHEQTKTAQILVSEMLMYLFE